MPKSRCKSRIPIWHNWHQHSMKLDHLINIQFGQSLQRESATHSQQMCQFGESIHNHPNDIVVDLSTGQTDNEVHGDVFPLPFRYKQRLKSFGRFLMFCLHFLTCKTLGHKFNYVFLHTSPLIVFFDDMVHLGTIGMHFISRIMCLFHNSLS